MPLQFHSSHIGVRAVVDMVPWMSGSRPNSQGSQAPVPLEPSAGGSVGR